MPDTALKDLIARVRAKKLVIPEFQREFRWRNPNIQQLIASIMRKFPIGGFLVMKNEDKDKATYSYRHVAGIQPERPRTPSKDAFLVLDGQQRITSCYVAFCNGMKMPTNPGRWYFRLTDFLKTAPDKRAEFVDYIVFYKKDEVDAKYSSTDKEIGAGLFPLDIIFSNEDNRQYPKWFYAYNKTMETDGDKNLIEELIPGFQSSYVENVTSYQIPVQEILDIHPESICAIFETINTTGRELDLFDLLVAKTYAALANQSESGGLRERLKSAIRKNDNIGYFDPAPSDEAGNWGGGICTKVLPRIIGLIEKQSCKKGELLGLKPEIITKHWNRAVEGLEKALGMMRYRFGCVKQPWIPAIDVIAPLSVILTDPRFTKVEPKGATRGGPQYQALLEKIAKWYWRSVFGTYFTGGSTDTQQATATREWIGIAKPGANRGYLDEGGTAPTSDVEFRIEKDAIQGICRVSNSLYKAILCAILLEKPTDFYDQKTELAGTDQTLEDHHIFPQSPLQDIGIKSETIYGDIANRTPILESTNRLIRSNVPAVYMRAGNSLVVNKKDASPASSRDVPSAVLKKHLIPEWVRQSPVKIGEKEFLRFLEERRELIFDRICKLTVYKPT